MRLKLAQLRSAAHHPGLLLQRYLARPQNERDLPEKRRALLEATSRAARSAPVRDLYAAAFERWTASTADDKPHRSARLSTADNRLIVGLGAENVLEVGLRLHHTYGVPMIPGSTLKGLASHYCHEVWGHGLDDDAPAGNVDFRRGGAHHALLFGTTEDAGAITFHDAWITPASLDAGALRHDVMTPHHPAWQTNGAPPTDFDSPVPVSFLSVAGSFDVRVSWSGPAEPADQVEAWTDLAMVLLQEALKLRGVGGKTSSGYGRLVVGEGKAPPKATPQPVELPAVGQLVSAVLVSRNAKGTWRANETRTGLGGAIQNTHDVPTDKAAGDTLKLKVASVNQREIHIRYPTEADLVKSTQAQRPTKSPGSRGRNPHGKSGR